MKSIIKLLKLTVINLAVFMVVLIIVAELAALAINTYAPGRTEESGLPNYQDAPWATTFYKEYKESFDVEYRDYVVWRRKPYTGETINVGSDGRRISTQPGRPVMETVFAFYGGSTMWGDGNRDQDTIPSVFARQNQVIVQNNGEGGYIARQSLAWLVNGYITEKDSGRKVVIFYDGVNDVVQRCWRRNTGIGTYHEQELREKIAGKYNYWIFNFRPVVEYVSGLREELGKLSVPESAFDCAASDDRAREVARTLIQTWRQAQLLAEAHGDSFIAVLQPVAYVGSPNLRHLPDVRRDRSGHAPEYQAVYAEIRAQVGEFPGLNFLDLTDAYDGDEYYYVDHSHVSPNAHRVLVKKLGAAIRRMGLL
jgi:hypothetical protein